MAKTTQAAKSPQKTEAANTTATLASSASNQASKDGTDKSKETNNSSAKPEKTLSNIIDKITHPFKTKKSLDDLFEAGLNDIYSAEKQLIKALPKMEKAACSRELKMAFSKHLKETERQAERLEKIFDKMEIDKTGESCKAMEGLVTEAEKIISEFESGPVCDSALIIAAQKVEHYEMATYGSLAELADVLGYGKAHNLLGKTLMEETQTDEHLTEIAMEINDVAYETSEEEDDEDEEEDDEDEDEDDNDNK